MFLAAELRLWKCFSTSPRPKVVLAANAEFLPPFLPNDTHGGEDIIAPNQRRSLLANHFILFDLEATPATGIKFNGRIKTKCH